MNLLDMANTVPVILAYRITATASQRYSAVLLWASITKRMLSNLKRTTAADFSGSYGLIADLLECILQRCLSYYTKDCRIAYGYVKACLADPSVTKVVLIGHSQGGIIASTVLDKLFGELPTATITKLVRSNPLINIPRP
jgi:putative lipase involved disintegration of autophagic bodies